MNQPETKTPKPIEPYRLVPDQERAEQIEFRRPQERCCFPLAALSRIHYHGGQDRITLSFFSQQVTIDGQQLLKLYEELVKGHVSRISEQGENEEAIAGQTVTTVRRITIGGRSLAGAAPIEDEESAVSAEGAETEESQP